MLADDQDNKVDLKAFHYNIINDYEALKEVIRKLDSDMVQRNCLQVKQDVQENI